MNNGTTLSLAAVAVLAAARAVTQRGSSARSDQEDPPTYPEGPQPLKEISGWYLDSEDSLICEECARESNNLDEVPQFRPIVQVLPGDLTLEDNCDQCSRSPDLDETCV